MRRHLTSHWSGLPIRWSLILEVCRQPLNSGVRCARKLRDRIDLLLSLLARVLCRRVWLCESVVMNVVALCCSECRMRREVNILEVESDESRRGSNECSKDAPI